MTKSPRKNVPDVGIELGAACMPSEHASDRATAPGRMLRSSNWVWRSFHTESGRWRSDACFSWCDEATRSSFHTARDKIDISTLSDLYMCSQVRNMSYASDDCRDGFSACNNAPVWIHHWNILCSNFSVSRIAASLARWISMWKDLYACILTSQSRMSGP